jgi:predicted nucleotidyltransferase
VTLLESALRRVADDLRARRTPFALVGGLAVSARCEPRFTRDVDLAVAVSSDREAEALVRGLMDVGYRVLAQVEQEATGRLATVRLSPPGEPGAGGVIVDLMFASSGIEPELTAAAEPLEIFPSFVIPVASVFHLIALKVLARDDRNRPQDHADLRQLLQTSTQEDLERVRSALTQIRERGFHRNRDLLGALDELLVE